jgi:2-desacetyl-2-hydroxyethyl bacteriochlorophyllide A dehydrogenase
MKAVLIKEFNKDFAVEEVGVPGIADDEALIKVKASCLCAADLKLRDGRMPHLKLPHIPGHEVVGEVAEIGKAVKKVKAGDRVVVYMYSVCRDCYACRAGRENLCVNIVRMGFERGGGHAEYVAVPSSQLLPLPDVIPYEEAAAIPDAISTMLHAIRDIGEVKVNDTVVLLGVGGLGMQGIQLAHVSGARVISVARSDRKLHVAKELGSEWAFNGNDANLVANILDVTHGKGADVVLDLVGVQQTFQTSINALKKGGTYVLVGSTSPEITFPVGQVMFKEIAIRGALGMKKETVLDAIELCRLGKIKPYVTDRFPLDGINEAAGKVKEGKVLGRSVLIP